MEEILKINDNGQWELEKAKKVEIHEHHRQLADILNNYESEGNPHFNHHHIASEFHHKDAKKIVDAHSADPDYGKAHTIKTVSNAYHKAIESDANYKPSRPIK